MRNTAIKPTWKYLVVVALFTFGYGGEGYRPNETEEIIFVLWK